jgi:hypothetical protein
LNHYEKEKVHRVSLIIGVGLKAGYIKIMSYAFDLFKEGRK